MSNPRIDFSDLPAEMQEKLRRDGVRPPRERKATYQATFKLEQVRQRALDVLAEISDLTQIQRARVLRHALKVNDV